MSGQDLAELRTGKQRRNRAKVEREREAEREDLQAERRRNASKIQKRAEASRTIGKIAAKVRRIAPGVLGFVAFVGIIGGAIYWYTHPQLSAAKVQEGIRPITVRIEKKLGATVELQTLKKDGDVFVAQYAVPKGTIGFSGRRVTRDCSATARIDTGQRLPISKYTYTVKDCRYTRRVVSE